MRAKLFAIALIVVATTAVAQAIDVSISATVEAPAPPTEPDTVVIFRGLAYPYANVTIQRQGSNIATVPADPNARFDVTLSDQPTGIITYAIFAEDPDGQVGPILNFTISVTKGTTTTLTGIFLGPTLETDKAQAKLSETFILSGFTAPLSAVTLFVSSGTEQTFTTTSDGSGLYVRQVLASDLGVGTHSARSKSVAQTQEISGFSNTVTVAVNPLDPCDGKNRADINCDGRVNLTDFSIMMFYWKKRDPTNTRTDINKDRVVNLFDLSILLYNWTR